ncbi:Response regulator transcription factor [Sulfidibacter corallicola]|uniref:Response regulator transcription factor n=1 Tax=Sulfidibacter corallicola TaxID=2818388 RepID=A0A8A4TGM2_SULCO|nr:LytTR family DNA-binding domain-containing protein [Sulfidibacter corallicola]QTD48667.1 response regulator transcription factor [Sulfidibacter corallicola]
MRILIVEDEPPIAEDLRLLVSRIVGPRLTSIRIETTLGAGLDSLAEKPVDLLLLDLNLHGRNGFDLLKEAVAHSFHTIVVSANTDRALEAFEYGVLDFVAKPYSEDRLRKALIRLDDPRMVQSHELRFLAVREGSGVTLVPVDELCYAKGADVYSELHLRDGRVVYCEKTLALLEQLLGDRAVRVHKSYLAIRALMRGLRSASGGKHELILANEERLPVSRMRYKALRAELEARG